MKISACWITRNECQVLLRSIKSVQDIADELIVVDTGSTDSTIEAAENLGAKVFTFEWIDDFSAARNYAIEKASGDIIIFLDSDEWFDPKPTQESIVELEAAFSNKAVQVLTIMIQNVDDSGTTFNTAIVQRIFRRQEGFCYANKIHEMLQTKDGFPPISGSFNCWTLKHSGYAGTAKYGKVDRNIEILIKEKYDDYRESARVFYLMREYYHKGDHGAAFPYFEVLLHNKKHVSDLVSNYGVMGSSCFPIAMDFAARYRGHVSRRDVHKAFVAGAQKLLPNHAGANALEMQYNALFDNQENVLLRMLSDYEKKHGNAVETDPSIDSHYRTLFFYIYSFSSYAYYRRGNKEMAGMHAIKAFKSDPANFKPQALLVLLQAIEGVQDAAVADLLMKTLEISNRNVMEGMMESLMYDKYRNIYLYFFKKQLDKGIAKKSRFLYLKILLGNYLEAAEAAVDAAVNNENSINSTEISEMVFLATICSGSKELYIKGKKYLGRYDAITKSFFDGIPLESPSNDEKEILREEYSNIMFAAGPEIGEKFLSVFANGPVLQYMIKCDYYMSGGLYEEFLSYDEAHYPPLGASGAWEMLADCYIGAKRYEDAFEIFNRLLEDDVINFNILNGVQLISEMAQGETADDARDLHNTYFPVWDELIDLVDIVQTGIVFDDSTRKEARILSSLSLEDFEQRLLETPPVTSTTLRTSLLEAAKIYKDKNLYAMAERCYRRLLAGGWETSEIYERLSEIFKALGNESLAAELLERSSNS